jgi:hypothetical protein
MSKLFIAKEGYIFILIPLCAGLILILTGGFLAAIPFILLGVFFCVFFS